MSNFSCSLNRNIKSHSKENLAFHSLLRWKIFSLPHSDVYSLKVGRMYFLSLGLEAGIDLSKHRDGEEFEINKFNIPFCHMPGSEKSVHWRPEQQFHLPEDSIKEDKEMNPWGNFSMFYHVWCTHRRSGTKEVLISLSCDFVILWEISRYHKCTADAF